MKLFDVTYLQDNDNGSYLTVGEDSDNGKSIEERELNSKRWEDKSCLYFFGAREVKEVDGHKISVC